MNIYISQNSVWKSSQGPRDITTIFCCGPQKLSPRGAPENFGKAYRYVINDPMKKIRRYIPGAPPPKKINVALKKYSNFHNIYMPY